MRQSMSKDERDFLRLAMKGNLDEGDLFWRNVRRAVNRAYNRHVRPTVAPIQNSIPSAASYSTAQYNHYARLLAAFPDTALDVAGLGVTTSQIQSIVTNPSRDNANRLIITIYALQLRMILESAPVLGTFLRVLRMAETIRRTGTRMGRNLSNPLADAFKAAFRRCFGSSIHVFLQCHANRIFSQRVLNAIPRGNERFTVLAGDTLRETVYRLRLWIVSRLLYFYGLRDGNDCMWRDW
jgi:hypothetical protein